MTQMIKIEVPLDSAKCVHRASNYYVNQLEYLGHHIVEHDTDLRELVSQHPDEEVAVDQVAKYEEDLARDLLHALAALAFPAEED